MSIWQIIIYSLIAGAATILGAYLVLFKEKWSRKNSIYLISFSAGVLLAVGFGRLIPDAQKLNPTALIWVLVSFLLFYILEHGMMIHSCHEEEDCEVHHFGRIALAGMTLHSLLDGLAIGVGFEVSPELGILATLSVLFHKLPDGISLTSIFLHSNYARQKTLIGVWLIALMTPLGAIGSFFLLKGFSPTVLGALLAVAAGSFFYVAAADLVPEIHKKSQFLNIVIVLFGAFLPFLVQFLLAK